MSEQNTIIFLNWPLCPGSVCYSGIVLPQRGCCNSNCYFSICGYPFQFCCYTTTASQNYGGHCLPSFARQNDTESPISLIFTCLKLPCSVAGMFVCIAGTQTLSFDNFSFFVEECKFPKGFEFQSSQFCLALPIHNIGNKDIVV